MPTILDAPCLVHVCAGGELVHLKRLGLEALRSQDLGSAQTVYKAYRSALRRVKGDAAQVTRVTEAMVPLHQFIDERLRQQDT